MRLACPKAPARKSRPKDQRSILADILLQVESPPSADEIVDQAEKAGYQQTCRPGMQIVTSKQSVEWRPGRWYTAVGYVGTRWTSFSLTANSLLSLPFHAVEWPL
jgi:hypothetical protein